MSAEIYDFADRRLRREDLARIRDMGAQLGFHLYGGDIPVTECPRSPTPVDLGVREVWPTRPGGVAWQPCGHRPLLWRLFHKQRRPRDGR